jgi:F-type H+-transporting ATPase subunit alpha
MSRPVRWSNSRRHHGHGPEPGNDNVGVVIFGSDRDIKEGDTVKRTGAIVDVPVGKELLGRVVDGSATRSTARARSRRPSAARVDVKAPGIIPRKSVHEPMATGLKAVDAMIPVGRGQRELIIGDRQTGKTAIILDTILNQKPIHDAGDDEEQEALLRLRRHRPEALHRGPVREDARRARRAGILDRRGGTASDPAPMQFLAPFAGCAMGEYFRDNGMHALIIYDDLSKQAVPIARCRCCCAARRAAKPIRVTCSTCTRACWSVRRS